jgi:integrase
MDHGAAARSAPFVRVAAAPGGADLKTVSTALGHSTIAVTADTYAHVSPAMLHDAANVLDRVVEPRRKAGVLQRV